MGELNKEYEARNQKLQENVNRLEGEVNKMAEENNKFAENNKQLEEQVGNLKVSNLCVLVFFHFHWRSKWKRQSNMLNLFKINRKIHKIQKAIQNTFNLLKWSVLQK